jgi:hypothetical protein
MRVLVCGGRTYQHLDRLSKELGAINDLRPISCIISGCARGADTLAMFWAKQKGIEIARFPADWKTYGLSAGSIRNQQMLDEGKPEVVVAFPGGRGTADMVSRARKANLEVIEVS